MGRGELPAGAVAFCDVTYPLVLWLEGVLFFDSSLYFVSVVCFLLCSFLSLLLLGLTGAGAITACPFLDTGL